MNDSSALLVAAAISAVVAMLVVTLRSLLDRKRQVSKERVERLAAFFADAHAVTIAIGSLARSEVNEKDDVETQVREQSSDRFNLRLAQIRLLEDEALIEFESLARSRLGAHDRRRMD